MTRLGRCYAPEKSNHGVLWKDQNSRRNITDAKAAEFWKKMQPKDYSVEDQLKKTSAQISVMSLLMSSKAHRNALMEVLYGVNIPKETTNKILAASIERVVEANKVSFHDDESSSEKGAHNKALYIVVIYHDKFVNRVLIDGGLG
ncbi:hypothetical protein P3S67_005508 [Capsicum chacoense]